MPSKLRAGGTFPYVLTGDRNQPDGEAVFKLRILSCHENETLIERRNDYIAAKLGRAEIVADMLDLAVDSWEVAGSRNKELTELLTDMECWELISACIEGATLSEDERKKFVLPSKSEMGSFANGAAVASAMEG